MRALSGAAARGRARAPALGPRRAGQRLLRQACGEVAAGAAPTPAAPASRRLPVPKRPLRGAGYGRAVSTQVLGADLEDASASSEPSALQLRRHFVQSMVPMVGFGFMDNTVMIHAGNQIDLTLGVTLGLTTLAAAACGQICSDVAGVTFGGVFEAGFAKLGLASPGFTEEQGESATAKRVGLLGKVVGVICGCSLGLLNLFLVDTHEAKEFKLSAAGSDAVKDFSVTINNQEREDCTAITIEGPATKGLLASAITALGNANCAIAELVHDDSVPEGAFKVRTLYVKKTSGSDCSSVDLAGQVDADDLESIARAVMSACEQPERFQAIIQENITLRRENQELHLRKELLEGELDRSLISVTKSARNTPLTTSD